ncbi:MAG: SPOR domain-containing protein, partial [Prolixibacteraceae bacterium]|nr:SPOR domain-containing protein [Prolixibacteraceae bacterium]
MEINHYIKELLLLNDCVIIPEFGGFVANYKPATNENNRFFPPTKEIAFNNKLISNDGLLINHISQTEGISYFSARQK